MKKVLNASCCLALVALVAFGLRATEATTPSFSDQAMKASIISRDDHVIQDMALQSELIVTGRCLGTRSTWVEDGRVLVTLATISVDEVLKGNQTSNATVVLPGGVDANRRIPVAMTYAGAPRIAPQEEILLFLTGEDVVAGAYAITGFAQGKYSIVEDEEGQKLVSRDPIGTRVQRGPGLARGGRQFVPLSEFKQKVRGYLGQ